MGVITERYIRKPLYVDAVRVNANNFDDCVAWCRGEVMTDEVPGTGTTKKYIKVRVTNPKNQRQTKAFINDWILYTDRGYKVYTNKAFRAAFDLVEGVEAKDETETPTRLGNVSYTPEERDQLAVRNLDEPLSDDEEQELATAEEIREKLPQAQDRRPVDAHTTPQGEPHEYVEATPQEIAAAVNEQPSVKEGRVDAEAVIDSLVEADADRKIEQAGQPQPVQDGGTPESEGRDNSDNPVGAAKETSPSEGIVPVEPEMLEDAPAAGTPIAPPPTPAIVPPEETPQPEPVSKQPPQDAAAGKMVLSLEEQKELGPEEVRELLSSGDVILAQDLAESA